MVALKCTICFSSRSGNRPSTRASHEDWCAFTSCGHVYHLSCVETWHRSDKTAQGCPNRCPSLNVKRAKRPGGNLLEALPYLRLFIDSTDADADADAPSSEFDAVAAEAEAGVKEDKKPRVVRGRGKGKARALVPDDDDEEEEEEEDAGGPDALARLRRERNDALNTVREQRAQVRQLSTALSRLQATAGALAVAGPSRKAQGLGSGAFAGAHPVESRFFRRRSELRGESLSSNDDETDLHQLGGGGRRGDGAFIPESRLAANGERIHCDECGQDHRGEGECEPFAAELFVAQAQIARLRDAARHNDPQAVAALAAQLRSLQTRHDALQAAYNDLVELKDEQERRVNELQNVHDEAEVRWLQDKRRLEKKLEESGASGEELIRQLGAEIDEKDRQILLINGRIDGAEYAAEKALKEKAVALDQARREVAQAKAAAQNEVNAAQQKCSVEYDARRRVERANEVMRRKLTKYRTKLQDAQMKRGILQTESDNDDDDDASAEQNPAALTSTTPSRTRPRASLSPDPAEYAAFRVNNNSRLLASPTKRARARTAKDACEVDKKDADDDLESVDEPFVLKADDSAENQPPIALDSDSDVEIVESSYFCRPAASTSASSAARPLATRRTGASNVPPSSAAGAGLRPSTKRAFGLTTLADGTRLAGGSAAKKPARALARSDKYLPDFASGLAGTGPKHRLKRK
ncbi:hypothetical protein JCM3770_000362 [Rhodotorula araucariae]